MAITRTEGVLTRELDGELVIYDPERDLAHALNPTAKLVWDLCGGRTDQSIIVQAIRDRYDVADEVASRDVQTVLDQFRELDLISGHTPSK